MSGSLLKYVLKGAFRDRLFLSFFIVFLIVASLSFFMGDAAATEKNYFALVFMGGSMRLTACAGLVLFVVFFIQRSRDSRNVEFILSHPVGKLQFVISYIAAFALLAVLCCAAMGAFMMLMLPQLDIGGFILWLASMAAELSIMTAVAFFFAMFLRSAAIAAMAAFGLYALSRMMGQILSIIDHNAAGAWSNTILEGIMQAISMVMPRLDLMGQTGWLLYGPAPESHVGLTFIAAHGLAYIALLVTASYIDLRRKQF